MATVQDVLARVRAKHERFTAAIESPDLLRRTAGRPDAPAALTELAEAVAAGRTTWAAVLDGPGSVPEIRRLYDTKNMAAVSEVLERQRADDVAAEVVAGTAAAAAAVPEKRRQSCQGEDDVDSGFDPVFETKEEAEHRVARHRVDAAAPTRQELGWSW